jgi:hypothetical protein
MRHKIAAALLLFFSGVVLVCAGTSFACYALYAAFVPLVGEAAAAAIAAAVLILIAVFGLAASAFRAKAAKRSFMDRAKAATDDMLSAMGDAAKTAKPTPDDVALNFLAAMAKERPIIAVGLATLLGAATSLLRNKK